MNQTLHLKRKHAPEPATHTFNRRWHEHLTEMQLAALVNRFGNTVEDIASVQLLVTFRGGKQETLDAPSP